MRSTLSWKEFVAAFGDGEPGSTIPDTPSRLPQIKKNIGGAARE